MLINVEDLGQFLRILKINVADLWSVSSYSYDKCSALARIKGQRKIPLKLRLIREALAQDSKTQT